MKLSRSLDSRLHGWPPTSRFPALSRVFSDTDAFSAHSGRVYGVTFARAWHMFGLRIPSYDIRRQCARAHRSCRTSLFSIACFPRMVARSTQISRCSRRERLTVPRVAPKVKRSRTDSGPVSQPAESCPSQRL